MTRYFLHHRRGFVLIRDDEGSEFANLAEARSEAIRAARDLVMYMVTTGVVDLSDAIEIEGPDGEGTVVLYSEAVCFKGWAAGANGALC